MSKDMHEPSSNQPLSAFSAKVAERMRLRFPANNKIVFKRPLLRQKAQNIPTGVEGLLAKLIAMPTVTHDLQANNIGVDIIAKYLKKRGMYIAHFVDDGRHSIVATTRPDSKTPTVMLTAHLDVVPGTEEQYILRKEDGKYIGRGVLDMKVALAAYMQVVDELRGHLDEYDFGVMVTTDEETAGKDGMSGVRQLVDRGYLPKVAILPDGGKDWQIESGAKGFIHYTLEAHGKAAHGSRPWEGDNAAFKLITTLHEIKDYFKNHGPDTDTLNIGVVESGEAFNKIPDYARAEIEVRPNKPNAMPRLKAFIETTCQEHGVDTNLRSAWEPIEIDMENKYIKGFTDCIEEVTGVKNVGIRSFAGNDGRFFAYAGVPYVSLYPPGGGHHSANEWLSEEALFQFPKIVRRYLEQTAHLNPPKARHKQSVDTDSVVV